MNTIILGIDWDTNLELITEEALRAARDPPHQTVLMTVAELMKIESTWGPVRIWRDRAWDILIRIDRGGAWSPSELLSALQFVGRDDPDTVADARTIGGQKVNELADKLANELRELIKWQCRLDNFTSPLFYGAWKVVRSAMDDLLASDYSDRADELSKLFKRILESPGHGSMKALAMLGDPAAFWYLRPKVKRILPPELTLGKKVGPTTKVHRDPGMTYSTYPVKMGRLRNLLQRVAEESGDMQRGEHGAPLNRETGISSVESTKIQEILVAAGALRSVFADTESAPALEQLQTVIAGFEDGINFSAIALRNAIGRQTELRPVPSFFMMTTPRFYEKLLGILELRVKELEALQFEGLVREVWDLITAMREDLVASYHFQHTPQLDWVFKGFLSTPRVVASKALRNLPVTGAFWSWRPELRESEWQQSDLYRSFATYKEAAKALTKAYTTKVARLLDLLPYLVNESGEPLWA